jgi:hypothetical protein
MSRFLNLFQKKETVSLEVVPKPVTETVPKQEVEVSSEPVIETNVTEISSWKKSSRKYRS